MTDNDNLLMEVFFPYTTEKQKAVKNKSARFVHYTRAEAAMSILRSREVWLRNASCMIDLMEVQHGLQCLASAYNGEVGKKLKATLNNIFDGISTQIEERFNEWHPYIDTNTYLVCVSEHLNEEDRIGRLSMWRACGGKSGIALVMNNTPFLSESVALKAYTSPVAYLNDATFPDQLMRVVVNIEKNADYVRSIGRDAVFNCIFQAFRFAAVCTKHPGFHEEKEWRVIYMPRMEESAHVKKCIQTINGIPQTIYKISLRDIPDEGLVGMEISSLIDRIIIGPSDYPVAMLEAFRDLLAEAGVEDPGERVYVSDIPLRV